MAESFGARLRRQREQQNIALATIAEQTKIKESLLEALERDDVSRWPSGIFRRAYIRAYAHAIGLRPEVVVHEFLELYPDPAEEVSPIAAIASAVDPPATPGGPPTRLRFIVGSAMASLARLRRNAEVGGPVGPDTAPGHAARQPDRGTPEQLAWEAALAAPPENAFFDLEQDADRTFPLHVEPAAEPSSVTSAHIHSDTMADVSTSSVPPAGPDFTALASLCTELGRVQDANRLQVLLQDAARLLDAPGLILWVWDASAAALRPALVCGYSDEVVAQLPVVTRDADNATAAAFRTAETRVINASRDGNGALVVPLLAPAGCAGVLALEMEHGAEHTESVRAAAIILAALLAQLIGAGSNSQA